MQVHGVGIIASPHDQGPARLLSNRRLRTASFRFARHKESRPDGRAGRFQPLALASASPKVWNRLQTSYKELQMTLDPQALLRDGQQAEKKNVYTPNQPLCEI